MTRLSDTLTIRNLTLANRLVMPPMATAKADENGCVTQAVCSYYWERARHSKIGLIITEHSYIHRQRKAHPGQTSLASDEVIPALRHLTDGIHQAGVKVFAQLSHAGTAARSKITGQFPVGPSPLCHPKQREELPREMTHQQIRQVTAWFAQAALRAQKAGFDGVELHAAHGYLLNQFFSPLANQRTDGYGPQSVEHRIRFLWEVIQAVRQAVGEAFPLSLRLGGCDYEAGGSTVDDCVEACRLLERSGVDLFHLTGGMNGFIRPGHGEPGYFRDLSTPVKRAVALPVLLTGGVTTPAQAEALLEEGCADLIGVGRAILKNAHWAD